MYNKKMDDEQRFKDTLRSAGERITTPRLSIFRILNRYAPLSMAQLVDRATADGADTVTIYRTLTLFRRLNLAQEVGLGRNRLFELSDSYHAHHHHFTCVHCGEIIDFEAETIESEIQKVGVRFGVKITSHQLEVSGVCRKCLGMINQSS